MSMFFHSDDDFKSDYDDHAMILHDCHKKTDDDHSMFMHADMEEDFDDRKKESQII